MKNVIINRGRGPQIAGSRITVYDILYESQEGLSPAEIAELFSLQKEQIEAALQYIDEHREQVLEDYRRIRERHARGNPEAVQAKLNAIHEKYAKQWSGQRNGPCAESGDAGTPR